MNLNVQLYGYTRNNLGDDMFIRFLVSSYPNVSFNINIKHKEHTKPFEGLKNLKINICENVLDVSALKNIDACVYIAGSIFMEKGNALKHLKCFCNHNLHRRKRLFLRQTITLHCLLFL